MYSVMLIDDEVWSLEGLEASFQWESFGFRVDGMFSESRLALAYMETERPDIVFTDIRMPDFTGLDIMRHARKNGIDAEFIIVSGYAYFDYAKEAVKNGAFDYLLKPVDIRESGDLLRRLKKHMDDKRITKDAAILRELLGGRMPPGIFQCLDSASCLQALTLIVPEGTDPKPLAREALTGGHGDSAVFLQSKSDSLTAIFSSGPGMSHEFLPALEAFAGTGIYVGVSGTAGSTRGIPMLIRQSMLAASGRFAGRKPSVVFYEKSAYKGENDGKKLVSLILDNETGQADALLDGIVSRMKAGEMDSSGVAALWNQVALIFSDGAEGEDSLQPMDFMGIMDRFPSVEEMCDRLRQAVSHIVASRKNHPATGREYNENFLNLLSYVREHFCEKLNLNQLAREHYLNMSYCSELFKKVTGENYSDYVTLLRMEKAEELLTHTSLSIKEIAYKTGYSDSFYFSKVFKRHFGYAPTHHPRHPA